MTEEYRKIWQELGINLKRHDGLLAALPGLYQEIYLSQKNRPAGMGYFDFVVSEVHGLRIKELMEHKARGGKVFATFCVYASEEVIVAGGGISVGLCGGLELTVPVAEQVLPRNLCPLIKSAFGFKLARLCPYWEAADLIVGETTCDGKKKTWEIMADHGLPMYVIEIPNCKRKKGQELWVEELIAFKNKVEEVTGKAITAEKLAEATRLINEKRAALQRLFNLRRADPVPISGKDALLVSQISFYDDPRRFAQKVNELCDELEARVERREGAFPADTPRLLVTGTPIAFPFWKLHHIVETSGAAIVCEESCVGTRLLTGSTEIPPDGVEAQLAAIAERQMKTHCACFSPNDERLEDIFNLAREYKADGVIQFTLQFCQPFNVEAARVEKRLEKEGIPCLSLESDYSEGDVEQIRTRVEAFLEMIRS
ncbi:MAG: double-cubane-cluster-containing anaerobic reductase [Anaerolineae bacterium]